MHDLTPAPLYLKTRMFVMPAWIAGIQVSKDASGDIHVGLDSSTPCWNDAIEGSACNERGASILLNPADNFDGGFDLCQT
jgi:hypothetical protein